jgi:plastocyanin domain-containing protein
MPRVIGWVWAALIVAALAAFVVVVADAGARTAPRRAVRRADGTQELTVLVDRGYDPRRIELEAGVPAMLRFERRGDDPCLDLLVSDLWPNAHRLAPNGATEIRFTPQRAGRFAFTCGMGMYSGELTVHEHGQPVARLR